MAHLGGVDLTAAQAALLADLIDYAGLFPPASLSLPQAVGTYLDHRADPAAGMLARFIIPAARLAELEPWLTSPPPGQAAWRLSVLAAPGDIPVVAAFVASHPDVRVEALETKVAEAGDGSWRALRDVVACVSDAGLGRCALWCEAVASSPTSLPTADTDRALLQVLAEHPGGDDGPRLGYKLRCGGVTPAAIPPVARVAHVVAQAHALSVPLKCTAGLHHPVRGMAHVGDAPMHGFLNVVGAGLLAQAHDMAADALVPIVTETAAQAFGLDAAGFRWHDQVVPIDAIQLWRRTRFAGFGSCSFIEPRDDLRDLGMLDRGDT